MSFYKKTIIFNEKFWQLNQELLLKHGPKIKKYLSQLSNDILSLKRITELETMFFKYLLLGADYKENCWQLEHAILDTKTQAWEEIYKENVDPVAAGQYRQKKQTLANGHERKDLAGIFGINSLSFIEKKLTYIHSEKCKDKIKTLAESGFDYNEGFIAHRDLGAAEPTTRAGQSLFLTLSVYRPDQEKVDCLFIHSDHINVYENYERNRKYLFAIKAAVAQAIVRSQQEYTLQGLGLNNNQVLIAKAYTLQQFNEKHITSKAWKKSLADYLNVLAEKKESISAMIASLKETQIGQDPSIFDKELLKTLEFEQDLCEINLESTVLQKINEHPNISILQILLDETKKITQNIGKAREDQLKEKNPLKVEQYEQSISAFEIMQNLFNEILYRFCEFELNIPKDAIVIAKNISNSMMKELAAQKKLKGVLTAVGGPGSHVLIFARNSNLPALVRLNGIEQMINNDSNLIIDMRKNQLIVNPKKDTLNYYQFIKKNIDILNRMIDNEKFDPFENILKEPFKLHSSLDNLEQLDSINTSGSHTIGLVRTENIYYERAYPPELDEHLDFYKNIAKKNPAAKIRTFDFSGDKNDIVFLKKEHNQPYHNTEFARSTDGQKMLYIQFLGFLQTAAAHGLLHIFFPTLNNFADFQYYKTHFEQKREEFLSANPNSLKTITAIQVGAMLESKTINKKYKLLSDNRIFAAADFFSIGSADLACSVLGITNRENEYTIYHSLHPKVLKKMLAFKKQADKQHKTLSICGNIGGDLLGAFVFYHLGLRDLTISAFDIPKIAYLYRRLGQPDKDYVKALKRARSLKKVIDLSKKYITKNPFLGSIFSKLMYEFPELD
jgi:phosphoenolpyruvate-protein kinase (PTS system EI component)